MRRGLGRMRGGSGRMREPAESEECNPGSSWNFAKQSWNPPEFGSATHVMPSSKQYNPGRVRNFPWDFQATTRNKPGAKFSCAKNSRCEISPLPVTRAAFTFKHCNTCCMAHSLHHGTSHHTPWLVKFLLGGGRGPWSPPKLRGAGFVKRGSKGHKLISSLQMSEIFCSNLFIGGGDVLERLTTIGGALPPGVTQ